MSKKLAEVEALLGPLPDSRLTALSVVRKNGQWLYKCVCACGNPVTVARDKLLTGHPKSCGCLRAETLQDFHAKKLAMGAMQDDFYARRRHRGK